MVPEASLCFLVGKYVFNKSTVIQVIAPLHYNEHKWDHIKLKKTCEILNLWWIFLTNSEYKEWILHIDSAISGCRYT